MNPPLRTREADQLRSAAGMLMHSLLERLQTCGPNGHTQDVERAAWITEQALKLVHRADSLEAGHK